MTTFYFCDNTGPGAAPGCPNGNNANTGTDPANPKQNTVGFSFPSSGGHTYLFARGSSLAAVPLLSPPSGTATAKTLIGTYEHPSFANAQLPILRAAANSSGVGQTLVNCFKRNYIDVRDLDLRGAGTDGNGTGVNVVNARNVSASGCKASGFRFGMATSDGDLSAANQDISFTNNELSYNRSGGFFGGADRLLLAYNLIHHNGIKLGGLYHNVYLAGTYYGKNMIVRGNILTHNEQYETAESGSVSLVGHGWFDDLLIEDNLIIDTETKTGHQGIAINGVTGNKRPQGFNRMVIRNNLLAIKSFGGVKTGITWNNAPDAVVENNVVVCAGQGPDTGSVGTFAGIAWALDDPNIARGDLIGARAKVRNNTVYIHVTTENNVSIGSGIRAASADNGGDEVVGNLIILRNDNSTQEFRAFNLFSRAPASFAEFSNNLAVRIGGGTLTWSNQHATVALAQAAGWGFNNLNADPLLVAAPTEENNWNVKLQTGSPAIGASHPSKSARLAYGRKIANGTRDIGAEDNGATVVAPEGPVGLSIA